MTGTKRRETPLIVVTDPNQHVLMKVLDVSAILWSIFENFGIRTHDVTYIDVKSLSFFTYIIKPSIDPLLKFRSWRLLYLELVFCKDFSQIPSLDFAFAWSPSWHGPFESHWAISHCLCAWVQTMKLMRDNDGVKLIYKKAFWINKPLRQNAKFLIWQTVCQILTFWDNRYILSSCTERVHSCKSEMIEI